MPKGAIHDTDLDVELGSHDPMLAECEARYAAEQYLPIDRANAAARVADESYPMAAESPDYEKRTAEKTRLRVFRAARLCALAEKDGDDELALQASRIAEGEALVLAAFDSANLNKDPLRREVVA